MGCQANAESKIYNYIICINLLYIYTQRNMSMYYRTQSTIWPIQLYKHSPNCQVLDIPRTGRQRLKDDPLSMSLRFFNLPLGIGPNDSGHFKWISTWVWIHVPCIPRLVCVGSDVLLTKARKLERSVVNSNNCAMVTRGIHWRNNCQTTRYVNALLGPALRHEKVILECRQLSLVLMEYNGMVQ